MPIEAPGTGRRRRRAQACLSLLLATVPGVAGAQTYAEVMRTRMDAITVLAMRAQELCAPLPDTRFDQTTTELKAEASAKLAKTFQFIADAGASSAINRTVVNSQGVPRDALADLLKDRGNCPSNFVIRMTPLVLVPPPAQ